MYRCRGQEPEVLLVHPGGPFWRNKDSHCWSIPKGEPGPGEPDEAAAAREFEEETGFRPAGVFLPLGETVQASGKHVVAFAVEGDLDPGGIVSVTCEVEWPPKSGKRITVPEVDRAGWFTLSAAHDKLIKGQEVFLGRLAKILSGSPEAPGQARS